MEALGREFNVLPVADDVYVALKDCAGLTFVGVNAAGETWTLTEATSAAGAGAQVLATITRYHVSTTVGSAWILKTQVAGSAVVTLATEDAVVIEVDAAELSAGFTHAKLTSTGAGTVVALQRDLEVQRKPSNLPALI